MLSRPTSNSLSMDAISMSSDAGWDARYAEKGTDGPRGQFTT
jgi:hypothetical protein